MVRALVVVVLVASLTLAGCAGSPTSDLPGDLAPPPAGSGRLEGSVVNDAFVGVPGATVRLLGHSETRKTDLDGKFVFAALGSGTYTLRVESPGWRPAEV